VAVPRCDRDRSVGTGRRDRDGNGCHGSSVDDTGHCYDRHIRDEKTVIETLPFGNEYVQRSITLIDP